MQAVRHAHGKWQDLEQISCSIASKWSSGSQDASLIQHKWDWTYSVGEYNCSLGDAVVFAGQSEQGQNRWELFDLALAKENNDGVNESRTGIEYDLLRLNYVNYPYMCYYLGCDVLFRSKDMEILFYDEAQLFSDDLQDCGK